MEEDGTCFEFGPFFPSSAGNLNQANVQQSRRLLLEPDWIFILSFILLMILGFLLCLFIWYLSDKYGWFKTKYTETWYHAANSSMNLFNFHSRTTTTEMITKINPASKNTLENDLIDDELFDYKDQQKVEEFKAGI
jgi:hypothetical protein